MDALFNIALKVTAEFEGGYSDHPDDPGGATNLGITIGTLSNYLGREATVDEVKDLTKDEAKKIYKKLYWEAAHCDLMSLPVAICVFDAAVNSGPSRAIKWLQEALDLTPDGIVGKKTKAKLKALEKKSWEEEGQICTDMIMKRLHFMIGLRHWGSFKNGWTRRILELHHIALSSAEGPVDGD